MKTKLLNPYSLLAAMSLLALATTNASAQATAFTYQGRLDNGGTPANGFYDVTFTLFSVANGAGQIGSPQTSLATPVSNGLFTVTLDFGANFPGAGRWLELAVRTNGGGVYTVLEPRQPITAAPYAITAGTITGPITEAQLPGNTAKLNVANNTSQATAVPVITSGFITGATITSGGSGYITPPTVTVNAALGSGAVITAGISGGVVTVLTVQNAGSGYISGATITIAPPPSNSYQVFTSTNYFGAANFLTNANNTIAGNFSGNGAAITGLDANNVSAGTLNDARLSGNVALRNGNQTFTGINSFAHPANFFAGDGAGLTNVTGTFRWQAGSTLGIEQMEPNLGYFATIDSASTFRLPVSPMVGDMVKVATTRDGFTWTIHQNSGQQILTQGIRTANATGKNGWFAAASSADGSRLVVVPEFGTLWISTNSGLTWISRESPRAWRAVALSTDGGRLVAVVSGGQIYVSADGGNSWTPRESNRSWSGAASSADGSKLVAMVSGGQIYTSTDFGVTWIARETSRPWRSVASSSDGSKLVAAVQGGQIYTSVNSGTNWVARDGNRNWNALASSSMGDRLVAVVFGGQIYTSVDSGTNWVARGTSGTWWSVASSSDGNKLLAGLHPGAVYTSADAGTNWTAEFPAGSFNAVASSGDGSKLTAFPYNDRIYYSTNSGLGWFRIPSATTVGVAGYMEGNSGSVIELLYIGGGAFMPVGYIGEESIAAY